MSEANEKRALAITLGLLFAFLLLAFTGVWTVAIPELGDAADEGHADGGAPAAPAD